MRKTGRVAPPCPVLSLAGAALAGLDHEDHAANGEHQTTDDQKLGLLRIDLGHELAGQRGGGGHRRADTGDGEGGAGNDLTAGVDRRGANAIREGLDVVTIHFSFLS